MQLQLLALVQMLKLVWTITLSETHGELLGVKVGTLELPVKVMDTEYVVFKKFLCGP